MSKGNQQAGDIAREKILAFVIQYKRSNDGASPSLREICEGCDIRSTSNVHFHLKALNDAGRIELDFATARNIRIPGGEWVYRGQP